MKLLRFYPLLLTALLQLMPLARVVLTDQLPAAPGASILFKWAAGAFALMGGLHAVVGASVTIISQTSVSGTNGVFFRYRIVPSETFGGMVFSSTGNPTGVTNLNDLVQGVPNFFGTTTMTVRVQESGYPTISTNVFLTFFSRPVITNQPVNQFIPSGGNATFSVSSYGSATMVHQWFGVAGGVTNLLPNATNASVTVSNITTTSNYFAIITNAYGRATSSLASVTIVSAPAVTVPPADLTVTASSTANFSVTATGGNLAYRWRTNGITVGAATNATLALTNVPSGLNGVTVDVVVTNVAGSVTSSPPAVLTVLFAPVFTLQPSGLSRPVGSNGTFTVAATGNPAPGLQWRKAGTALPGQNGTTLTFANIQPTDAGSYDVLATNSVGSVPSSTVTLTVLIPPAITNFPASRTNLVGTTATFTVGAAAFPPPSYVWRRNGTNVANGGNISGATTATLTLTGVQLTNAGSYEVIASNFVGVATSAPPAVLTVHAPPVITAAPPNRTVVAGSNTTFTVTATGSPAPAYQWRSNGVDMAGETAATLSLTNVPAAFNGRSFVVVVTNAVGSTSSPPAVLNVLYPPNFTAQPTNLTVGAGSPAAFAAAADANPAPAYQWRKNGANLAGATGATLIFANVQTTNAGNYDVVVTNSLGSVTSVVATLTVNITTVAPVITAPPTNLTVIAGSVAAFSATVNGTPPPTLQWRKDGANLPNETNVTFVINSATTNDAGSYDVVAANLAGSVTSAPPAVLTVLARPDIHTPPSNLVRFVGQSATFNVGAAGSGPLHFQWRFGQAGGTNLNGETNPSLVLTNLTTNHAGHYHVVVTNTAGETSSVPVTLTVAPLPLLQALGLQGKNTLMGLNVSPALPYNIEYATNASGPWLALTNLPVQAASTNFTVPDAITNDTRRFYRVTSP